MLKEFIADVSVLLFFSSFMIPYMILIQLFLTNSLYWAAYILPLLFGFSSSYMINKGHDSGFLKRTLITSAIVSVLLFVSIYEIFFLIENLLSQFQDKIHDVPTSQLPDFLKTILNFNKGGMTFQIAISSSMIAVGATIDALIKTVFKKKD